MLCRFLSPENRAEGKNDWWPRPSEPMNYRLIIGGQVVAEGDVEDLRASRFVNMATSPASVAGWRYCGCPQYFNTFRWSDSNETRF
jgi:hypothetical protein